MNLPPPPELLAPAGSLEMMRTAFAFGADAVYAGQPRYSLRVRNNSFSRHEVLAEGIAEAHAQHKHFYLVTNIYPHNAKIRTFAQDLEPILEMGPDALIMADPGMILMVKERWPEIEIHLSVQANTTNYESVRFWQKTGIKRVILSRELSLDEIAQIRDACPEMELEVFVHGALCIAYSGRCLLSGYFNHRDANQGSCTNACRWNYSLSSETQSPTSDNGRDWLLEEANRPGEKMPIEEDEHGTYIMNSRDLRAVEHVDKLVRMGVNSLKIEGRTKSPYYAARTCQTYRRAIDDAATGRPFNPELLGELEGLANRGYTDGFYQRHATQEYQNYLRGYSESGRSLLVGEVTAYDNARKMAQVTVKNAFAVHDRLEFIHPSGPTDAILSHMENEQGDAVTRVPGAGYQVWLPLPEAVPANAPCFICRYLNASPD